MVLLTIMCLFLKFIYFIYFWLRWVFIGARGLSLVAASRGYSLLWCAGFSLRWLLLLQSMGSRLSGLHQLWCTDLVAPRHVGSSWTRARTCVPCIGRRILNHCTTREVLITFFNEKNFSKKLVRRIALFNVFENLFNFWLKELS